MSTKPDPVPPVVVPPVVVPPIVPSMNVRDWFAGCALQGILSHVETVGDPQVVSKLSWDYANAMMALKDK